jgi:N-acetylglutamate synthase-like GNAT family acetyltransferase
MEITIETARPDDVDAVLRLLDENGLPRDGWRDHLDTTVVARRRGEVVGVAALEIYKDGALMRSVAVSPALHRQGLGHRLTEAVLQLARDRAAPHAYLLTTTAGEFFPKFGFDRVERTDVPASVQASIEFRSACPSSAVVMRKVLQPAGSGYCRDHVR